MAFSGILYKRDESSTDIFMQRAFPVLNLNTKRQSYNANLIGIKFPGANTLCHMKWLNVGAYKL
jgi:hypothetical protein